MQFAEPAGGGDVRSRVVAAILSCAEMLRCALKAASLLDGKFVFSGKMSRFSQPHRFMTIDAAAILAKKCTCANALKSIGQKGSFVRETRMLSEHRGSH